MTPTLQSIWSRFLIQADLSESQSEAARVVFGEIEKLSRWIPVSERLPEEDKGGWSKLVIVLLNNESVSKAYYSYNSNFWTFDNGIITHWMDMPALPTTPAQAGEKEEGG